MFERWVKPTKKQRNAKNTGLTLTHNQVFVRHGKFKFLGLLGIHSKSEKLLFCWWNLCLMGVCISWQGLIPHIHNGPELTFFDTLCLHSYYYRQNIATSNTLPTFTTTEHIFWTQQVTDYFDTPDTVDRVTRSFDTILTQWHPIFVMAKVHQKKHPPVAAWKMLIIRYPPTFLHALPQYHIYTLKDSNAVLSIYYYQMKLN